MNRLLPALAATWLLLLPAPTLAGAAVPDLFAPVATQANRPTASPSPIAPPTRPESSDLQAAPAPVLIGAVSVRASEAFQASEFSPVYEPYLGRSADAAVLRDLASSIAEVARRRGYLFASAVVPAQSLEVGVVQVVVDLGPIDEVRINGSTNRRLRALLEPLVGPAPLKTQVERRLLLAQDIPGVTIRNTRYDKQSGRGVLVVDVADDRVSVGAGFENYGSDNQGPYRARVSVEARGLIASGDALNLEVLNSSAHPKQLTYTSLRYALPVGSMTTVGVSAGNGHSKPGGALAAFDVEASTRYYAVFGSRVIARSKALSLRVNLELARLESKESVLSVLIQKDRMSTLSAWVSADANFAGGRLSGGLGLVRGFSAGPITHRYDLLSSRPDASAVFTKETAWASWIAPLGRRASIKLAANGQTTTRPLLSSQQIGLGGPNFGRAYDFNERFGDRGLAGMLELRRDFQVPVAKLKAALQGYGFVDGGSVKALEGGYGGGRLYSAGLGLRGRAGPAEFGVEAAAPLNTDRSKSRDRSPRVNLYVGLRF